jgi:hypothetical protein
MAMGDFNGDGLPDLVVGQTDADGSTNNSMTVLLGNGDGTFTNKGTFPAVGALDVAVGDFNGDGFADVAGSNLNVGIMLSESQTATTVATPIAHPPAAGQHQAEAQYGSANVFVTDSGAAQVYEILANGGYTTVSTLASAFSFGGPSGVAVDGQR